MTFTLDDVQKYARIGLQWLAAYLVTRGAIDPMATWVQPAIGLGVAVATFLWTLYGNRISAKLAQVEALPGVKVKVDSAVAPAAAVAAANDTARPKITLGS